MLKHLDKKFLGNDQIVLPCLEKDPYMIKYCNKKLHKDKKLFIKFKIMVSVMDIIINLYPSE